MVLCPVDRVACLATAATLLCSAATSAQPVSDAGPQVMGWVQPYGIEASTRALASTRGIGASLTQLGLQFWNPSVDGRGIVFAPVDATGKPVTAAAVRELQHWAVTHGVQPLLTVYNNSQVLDRWDWPLARHAFADHRDEFVAALVAAVETYQLAGVDVDLEGEGDLGADREAYASFVRTLSIALKSRGKVLTIDTFHNPCSNAPNMRWWSDWVGSVAAIHSMGSEDLYEGSKESFTADGQPPCEGGAALFRYSWQIDYGVRAGYRRDQIVLGMPTWLDSWGSGGQGARVVDHLREVRALGGGVGLWDMQLSAPGWTRPATWTAVQAVRRPTGAVVARRTPAPPRSPDATGFPPATIYAVSATSRSGWITPPAGTPAAR